MKGYWALWVKPEPKLDFASCAGPVGLATRSKGPSISLGVSENLGYLVWGSL